MTVLDELAGLVAGAQTICPSCGALDPDVIEVDFGIGPYEYWGAAGVDVQLAWVTRCCEADPEPFWPDAVEPNPDHIDESEVSP